MQLALLVPSKSCCCFFKSPTSRNAAEVATTRDGAPGDEAEGVPSFGEHIESTDVMNSTGRVKVGIEMEEPVGLGGDDDDDQDVVDELLRNFRMESKCKLETKLLTAALFSPRWPCLGDLFFLFADP